jgi:hypothetical protein
MVGPDSRRLPRGRRYLGDRTTKGFPFRLRDFHPLWSDIPDRSARLAFVTSLPVWTPGRAIPSTPHPQSAHAWHGSGLGCSLFARRYWGSRNLFSFPQVLRCFTSLRSLPVLPRDVPISIGTGFPIRKSPDQSLLGGSPRLIAADRVLHRRLAPRHPPCTLSSLTTPLRRSSTCVSPASRPWPRLMALSATIDPIVKDPSSPAPQDLLGPASPVGAPRRARGRANKKPRVPRGEPLRNVTARHTKLWCMCIPIERGEV